MRGCWAKKLCTIPSICTNIFSNCNSCCLFLSAFPRQNLRKFYLSFLRSFSLSSCSFNGFACNSAILLTSAAKFPIACVCNLRACRFSCGIIIFFFFFLLPALVFLVYFQLLFWFSSVPQSPGEKLSFCNSLSFNTFLFSSSDVS